MTPFEFFFTFYGLILGMAVAELLAGLSRSVQAGLKVGLLPALLVGFVVIDAATFWNQAWVIFRHAPFNLALLILGLVIAGAFYVAASLAFPREPTADTDLDAHFWRQRRTVLLCLLAANVTVASVFLIVAGWTGDLAAMNLGLRFWLGFVIFSLCTVIAAVARGRRVVTGALIVLLLYYAYTITLAAGRIVEAGGWPIGPRAEAAAGVER